MTNKEHLMELVNHRAETLPVIRDILAETAISDNSYAQIFQLMFSTLADGEDNIISYCESTKEWRIGQKPLSDLKLFVLLGKVHEIVRSYVLASWDECIFSTWVETSPMVDKIKSEMLMMENIAHLKAILKAASKNMEYSNPDGTISWATDTD